ncbi:hypothetical protein CYMTET_23655 [Cymbomonas tetramitiformis]|uniref:Uncharacterized protein n=1 Tax=Cymbomonas tetramitiformis TaxID=36881 RepID=A0AAE0L0W4_9CHLO|nr:hypothetical protein CYMTET_23655 [Cymbomonas tetramitiformis]
MPAGMTGLELPSLPAAKGTAPPSDFFLRAVCGGSGAGAEHLRQVLLRSSLECMPRIARATCLAPTRPGSQGTEPLIRSPPNKKGCALCPTACPQRAEEKRVTTTWSSLQRDLHPLISNMLGPIPHP